jgi:hypothetical protein
VRTSLSQYWLFCRAHLGQHFGTSGMGNPDRTANARELAGKIMKGLWLQYTVLVNRIYVIGHDYWITVKPPWSP